MGSGPKNIHDCDALLSAYTERLRTAQTDEAREVAQLYIEDMLDRRLEFMKNPHSQHARPLQVVGKDTHNA